MLRVSGLGVELGFGVYGIEASSPKGLGCRVSFKGFLMVWHIRILTWGSRASVFRIQGFWGQGLGFRVLGFRV